MLATLYNYVAGVEEKPEPVPQPRRTAPPGNVLEQKGLSNPIWDHDDDSEDEWDFGVEELDEWLLQDGDPVPEWKPQWGNLCKYYPTGQCRKGLNCPFSHNEHELTSRVLMGQSLLAVRRVLERMKGTGMCRLGPAVVALVMDKGDVEAACSRLTHQLVDRKTGNCRFWVKGWCREGPRCAFKHDWQPKWGEAPCATPMPVLSDQVKGILTRLNFPEGGMKVRTVKNGRVARRFEAFRQKNPTWTVSLMTFGTKAGDVVEQGIITSGVLSEGGMAGLSQDAPKHLVPARWADHPQVLCHCHGAREAVQDVITLANYPFHQYSTSPNGLDVTGFVCRVLHPAANGPTRSGTTWSTCCADSIQPILYITMPASALARQQQ